MNWGAKGFPERYRKVTCAELKLEGKHGKTRGHLIWRGTCICVTATRDFPVDVELLVLGKRVNEDETIIRGGLKYAWSTGTSPSGIVWRPGTPSTSA